MQAFYRAHYRPSNAILSISADIDEEKMLDLAEKWFEPLANRPAAPDHIRQEPVQTAPRREVAERDVPATTVSLAFHMGGRTSPDFYIADLVSDLLAGGDSARLYTHLVKEQRLLSSVNAYISGDVDPGLFVFTASSCRRRHPNRPKRPSAPKSKRSGPGLRRITRSRRSKTSSKPTRSSAN